MPPSWSRLHRWLRRHRARSKRGPAPHCRTEFYAQLADDVVRQRRTFPFGNWEGNWLAYNYAHDIKLPGSKGAPVAFLMSPQAESADGRLDSLDPDDFKYRIVSREIVA